METGRHESLWKATKNASVSVMPVDMRGSSTEKRSDGSSFATQTKRCPALLSRSVGTVVLGGVGNHVLGLLSPSVEWSCVGVADERANRARRLMMSALFLA